MMVCHPSPFGISGRFIGTMGTTGGGGSTGSTTNFGTFLFRTTGNSVQVALDD